MTRELNNLYEEKKITLRIIGLSNSSVAKTQKYSEKNNIEFPVYCIDDSERDQVQIISLPLTYILCPDGKVIQSFKGDFNISREIKNLIERR